MLNLKKTAVAVLALGSSAVFAGTMGPVCTPGAVTVPCESTAWDFGVQALYLKHTANNYLGYTTSVNNVRDYNEFDYDWGWGFKLEGSYHFSTGNDININWYHMSHGTDFGVVGSLTNGLVTTNAIGTGELKPEWDAVNFEFGQLVNFGEHKVIRFHGGAQYARVQQKLNLDFAGVGLAAGGTTLVNFNADTKYDGFGPRVGMDMSYHFGNGFAIYANGATALLVGSSSFDSNVSVANLNTLNGFAATLATGSRTTVVPEVEAKLGAMYNYAMGNGDLTLDAGYMVVNYFDTLQFAPTTNSSDNFSLHGPYFGAKWVGNFA